MLVFIVGVFYKPLVRPLIGPLRIVQYCIVLIGLHLNWLLQACHDLRVDALNQIVNHNLHVMKTEVCCYRADQGRI